MMEIGEDFIKFMQIGLGVIGLLAIFIIFISYNVTLVHGKVERETYVLGDYLLASKCLAETDNSNVIKSLFSEAKLINIDGKVNPSCISYSKGKVEINLTDSTDNWGFVLGPHDINENATFIVAVKMNDGNIKPANVTVTL